MINEKKTLCGNWRFYWYIFSPHTPPDIAIGQRGDSARLFKDDSKVTVDITPKVQEIPGARGEEIEAVAVNADPSREIEIQLLMDAEAALAAEEERVKKEIQELENNPKLSAKDKANKKRELLKALQKKKDKVRVQRQAEKVMPCCLQKSVNFNFRDQSFNWDVVTFLRISERN